LVHSLPSLYTPSSENILILTINILITTITISKTCEATENTITSTRTRIVLKNKRGVKFAA
jgi:hypothetical protein